MFNTDGISRYMARGLWVIIALMASGAQAQAQEGHAQGLLALPSDGYVYFNRPGATVGTHHADLDDCLDKTQLVLPSQKTQILDTGLIGLLVAQAVFDEPARVRAAASMEACMVVKGWRVVRLGQEEGAEVAALAPDALLARVMPWIGADAPHGDIVRVWQNDATRASAYASDKSRYFKDGQLSWRVLAADGILGSRREENKARRGSVFILPPKPLAGPQAIAAVPSGLATVVIHLSHTAKKTVSTLFFTRMGSDRLDRPSWSDNLPDMFELRQSGDKWISVMVAPGRWRVDTIGGVSTCLGGPAFEVREGEVVYAGHFDLASEDMTPGLDLAEPRGYLSGTPAAEIVRSAVYVNGTRGTCLPGHINYAIEFRDASFEPGYSWGSAAK